MSSQSQTVTVPNVLLSGCLFHPVCTTGAVKLPETTPMVMPGDNFRGTFELLTPIPMEPGLRFAIREGGRTVGAGVVSQIVK